jgi:ABC-type glycerol-3-phosphate transport system substrate-binding protein
MGNDAFKDLVGKVKSGKLTRRQFMTRAAALGVSATAVSSVLRTIPTRAQDNKEITMWTTFPDVSFDYLQKVVDPYNAQAQGHQVKLIQIPPAQVEDSSKLMTAVRGGTGPDVYLLDRFIVAERAAAGILEDLSALGADEVITQHVPFAQAEASFGGKVYALPFDTDARALYFNKTMLTEGGVDPEQFDPANGVVTWDAVAEAGNKLNKQDSNGNYTQMGFVPWANQGWHYTYGFSWGGKFFDEASCQVTPDEQAVVDAFTWVQNNVVANDAGKVQAFAGPNDPNVPGADPFKNPFYAKQQAFVVTGDWVIAQLPEYAPDMDYGITYMPVPKEGDESVTWAGGWSVVIPKGAKNPDEAWEFMQYFAGPEGQAIYVKESAHLPTIAALGEDEALFDERHKFFAGMLATAKNRPPLPVGAKYWTELSTAWQKNYLAEGEPAELLADVKERVNADLEQYCPISEG